jgi:hypothetical protein
LFPFRPLRKGNEKYLVKYKPDGKRGCGGYDQIYPPLRALEKPYHREQKGRGDEDEIQFAQGEKIENDKTQNGAEPFDPLGTESFRDLDPGYMYTVTAPQQTAGEQDEA